MLHFLTLRTAMQTSFGALFCLFYYQRYQNNPHLLTFIYNISATLGQNYLATRCHFDNSVLRFCNNINTEKYIRLAHTNNAEEFVNSQPPMLLLVESC